MPKESADLVAGLDADDVGFRPLLGQVAAGVAILTTVHNRNDRAITVTTLTSVSLCPPMVMVCIDHRSRFHAAVVSSAFFGASVLSSEQRNLSVRFAAPGRPVGSELAGVDHSRDITGAALLEGSIAQLEARVEQVHRAGDHSIVVGAVVAGRVCSRAPALVHHRSRYVSVG